MTILKEVLVKRTVFTTIENPADVKQYMDSSIKMGSQAGLYKDPKITAIFYGSGTTLSGNIKAAIDLWTVAPSEGNLLAIGVAATAGIGWLELYSNQVEVIANLDANRATRAEAYANIAASFLTPQKLNPEKKGKPGPPVISGAVVGKGDVDAEVINGADYNPSQTTIIAVETSANAVVSLVEGQLMITMNGKGQVVIKTASQKGKFTHFTGLNSGSEYAIYGYSQNGSKQVSKLSVKIIVTT